MNDSKVILAIDTSEVTCGICIYYSDKKYFSASTHLKHSHAEKIFDSIEWLFKSAKIKPKELDSVAISAGPGSFTGLRIGMSAAKGIAFGSGLPIITVPTYEALALEMSQLLPNKTKFIISNKINSEEVYFAKFQIKGNNYIFVDKLTVLKNDSFRTAVNNIRVFGNSAKLLDGSEKFPVSPDPVYVAKWALIYGEKNKTYEYDYLEPNYLKSFILKEKSK